MLRYAIKYRVVQVGVVYESFPNVS
jgi:hypothetical protein